MKIYTDPDSLRVGTSSNRAPTATVLPSRASEHPKSSKSPASLAVSFACCVQTVPDRTKTYADPASLTPGMSSSGAPTTAVSPTIQTELPNRSSTAASLAMSLACRFHAVPDRTKTYADPALLPPALSSRYAPTIAVLPEIETEKP